MNKVFCTVLALVLVVGFSSFAIGQLKVEGKGEEYHHALALEFLHSADHAKALQHQASLDHPLNMELVKQHADEIGRSLENARVDHAMIHKTYDEKNTNDVKENHNALLEAHTKALEAYQKLKGEVQQKNIDKGAIGTLATTIYEHASHAAAEHKDAMKKLGVSW